jgi:hypothetical protein
MARREMPKMTKLLPAYLFSASSSIELLHQWPADGVSAAAVAFLEKVAALEEKMELLFREGDGI